MKEFSNTIYKLCQEYYDIDPVTSNEHLNSLAETADDEEDQYTSYVWYLMTELSVHAMSEEFTAYILEQAGSEGLAWVAIWLYDAIYDETFYHLTDVRKNMEET